MCLKTCIPRRPKSNSEVERCIWFQLDLDKYLLRTREESNDNPKHIWTLRDLFCILSTLTYWLFISLVLEKYNRILKNIEMLKIFQKHINEPNN